MAEHRPRSYLATWRGSVARLTALASASSATDKDPDKWEENGSAARAAIAFLSFFALLFFFCPRSYAQESPYIVTYDHYLEEPGNLEVEYLSTFGTQRAGNDFHAFWVEFEYGVTAWYPGGSFLVSRG